MPSSLEHGCARGEVILLQFELKYYQIISNIKREGEEEFTSDI